jgi:hypothetical protein
LKEFLFNTQKKSNAKPLIYFYFGLKKTSKGKSQWENKSNLLGHLVNNYYLENEEKRIDVEQSIREGP